MLTVCFARRRAAAGTGRARSAFALGRDTMTTDVVVVHLMLAVVLFFLLNWIGGHATVTTRYYQITYFSRHDEAPAFNIIFRVLAPVVYIVIVGAMLYGLGRPRYVAALYMVVVYQQAIRWSYLLLYGRRLLVRWRVQFAIAAASTTLAVAIYRVIVSNPARLLPDSQNLANELWLVILAFIYKVADQSQVSANANIQKKEHYLARRYEGLRAEFGDVIAKWVPSRQVEPLVYAVLIYETFNRPPFARLLERVLPLGGPRSYGPMQVQAGRPLSDEESVREGSQKLYATYQDVRGQSEKSYAAADAANGHPSYPAYWVHREAAAAAAASYNVRSDYGPEVMSIHDFLVQKYYPDAMDDTVGLG
jgi:hypothetical protein